MTDLQTPYYAVIFSNQRTSEGEGAYNAMAARMEELAASMPGYLGIESARGEDGFGITVSYWETKEAIKNWKANAEHREAQKRGRAEWYKDFTLRIAKVECSYGMLERQEKKNG